MDLVLLTTPPHFRPIHYAAAVQAGKHVFLEKPCCVDAAGYRMLVAANEEAKSKKLSVGVGLQRRHQRNYLEGIEKIRDGAVGEIRFVRTYFNMAGGRSGEPKPADMSEMEYQIRHWNLFCWLCGDHLVEQACHEIDVANWVIDGSSGAGQRHGRPADPRRARHGRHLGPPHDRVRVCRRRRGISARPGSSPARGSTSPTTCTARKGSMTLGDGAWGLGAATPRTLRSKEFQGVNPYQREHDDLMASIRGTGPYASKATTGPPAA